MVQHSIEAQVSSLFNSTLNPIAFYHKHPQTQHTHDPTSASSSQTHSQQQLLYRQPHTLHEPTHRMPRKTPINPLHTHTHTHIQSHTVPTFPEAKNLTIPYPNQAQL
ncbi:hypothetical protein N7G274_001068 [Stereocaulon virgatum]|uniref:Uncharacterized protein n=1 Tax=Stereocaulon virgatum TaxID=373712 RepID=A0ABR4ANM7_9LECA